MPVRDGRCGVGAGIGVFVVSSWITTGFVGAGGIGTVGREVVSSIVVRGVQIQGFDFHGLFGSGIGKKWKRLCGGRQVVISGGRFIGLIQLLKNTLKQLDSSRAEGMRVVEFASFIVNQFAITQFLLRPSNLC